MLQSSPWFGNHLICFAKRIILTYEVIHTTESAIKHCRIGKYWTVHHGVWYESFFHTLSVTIYPTKITLRPGCSVVAATTTTHEENSDNKVAETSSSSKNQTGYSKYIYII